MKANYLEMYTKLDCNNKQTKLLLDPHIWKTRKELRDGSQKNAHFILQNCIDTPMSAIVCLEYYYNKRITTRFITYFNQSNIFLTIIITLIINDSSVQCYKFAVLNHQKILEF